MSAVAGPRRLDRLLHRLAFATRWAQLGLADLEARWFAAELRRTPTGRPVLVTALPRGGSTMLLELLAGCPEFAAQTYRDMPFVLAPMLWRAFARRFRRPGVPRERAHGDGIPVSLDSPEAFEEVLWLACWPEHYRGRTIAPWPHCAGAGFAAAFAGHRRKVVALRARDEPRAHRYLSKNNLNIARIPALWQAVPEALVVVPFRDPLQQAASLLRQHLRFSQLHRQDPFARRYMADLGHFDFGANLRPIDFGGWLGGRDLAAAQQLPFWLEYWLAAHRHLLAHAGDDRLVLVDFARLCAGDVTALADRLGTPAAPLQQQAARLRVPPAHAVDAAAVPPQLREALRDTHARLVQRAVP